MTLKAEEGKQFHMERMRQYQLNRLKYYYAVATFDSPKTADIIYMNCNGVEYESSGIRLDLRFIDDDITFDQVTLNSHNMMVMFLFLNLKYCITGT